MSSDNSEELIAQALLDIAKALAGEEEKPDAKLARIASSVAAAYMPSGFVKTLGGWEKIIGDSAHDVTKKLDELFKMLQTPVDENNVNKVARTLGDLDAYARNLEMYSRQLKEAAVKMRDDIKKKVKEQS